MQTSEGHSRCLLTHVVLCPAHPLRFPARLSSLTHGHCDSKGGEATRGFNQRAAGISENRGSWQTQPWQERQAHLLQGQALWKAQDSWLGLRSTARLVFFHSSSHIPSFFQFFSTWLGCGKAAVQQHPLMPFPRRWGRRLPDGRAG